MIFIDLLSAEVDYASILLRIKVGFTFVLTAMTSSIVLKIGIQAPINRFAISALQEDTINSKVRVFA